MTMSLHPTTCPGRMAVAIGLALALLIAPSANASHKTDHRFTVWGEIKYEDDAPAAELVVQLLVKDGAPMGEVKTDTRGRYRIVLHVHSEDVYKVFDMRVNDVTRKVRLLFNPGDRQTERGQRIDLVVKRAGEFETTSTQVQ
ncbi:MAG: hypothetical protein V3R24_01305 [Gemmatimonadales bacterium]